MKLARQRDLFVVYAELVARHLLTPRLRSVLISQVPRFPREVLSLARLLGSKLPESLEQVIAEDPRSSYFYARDILQEPFPLGEEVIASDAEYACAYARVILKGRFPQGEPGIAKSGRYSQVYSLVVLHNPFPLGEPAIAIASYGVSKEYYDKWYTSEFPTLRDWENSVLRSHPTQ